MIKLQDKSTESCLKVHMHQNIRTHFISQINTIQTIRRTKKK